MLVRSGGMILGRRTLTAGAALAIDLETIYAFGVSSDGLTFINFRPSHPYYVTVGPKNEPLHPPRSQSDALTLGASPEPMQAQSGEPAQK